MEHLGNFRWKPIVVLDYGFFKHSGNIGQVHNFTNHQQSRRGQMRRVMQIAQNCAMHLLMSGCRARDNGARRFDSQPGRSQPACHLRVVLSWHIDHQGRSTACQLAPVGAVFLGIPMFGGSCGSSIGSPMGGNEHERGRRSPMCQRNPGRRGRAQSRRHARNDLERNIISAQDLDLFTGTPKDQRVATLQSNNAQSRSRQCDHQEMDLFLADFLFSAALAHVVNPGGRWNEFEDFGRDQVVVQNGFGSSQHAKSLQRQQLGITRPCAYQINFACHAASPFALAQLSPNFRRTLRQHRFECFPARQRVQ